MKILCFGATGQLGRALRRRPPPTGAELVALDRAAADLSDPDALTRAVDAHAPDLVAIAAAYTAVDAAETDSRRAWAANATAPAVIAAAAARRGAAVIHVSTDYVFDGDASAPWRETDPVGPLGVYGASKRAGEIALAAANPRHAILRTSWVFDATGRNFLTTMLRLGAERDRLTIVDDQHGRPTAADDLADAILTIAPRLIDGTGATGLFHFTNGGPPTTWARFAETIFARARAADPAASPIRAAVVRIPTSDYPTPARRPKNSVLDLSAIGAAYGIAPRPWTDALDAALAELRAENDPGETENAP